eukprot:4997661-Alexandrium_andersonii.AAC.1
MMRAQHCKHCTRALGLGLVSSTAEVILRHTTIWPPWPIKGANARTESCRANGARGPPTRTQMASDARSHTAVPQHVLAQ